MNQTPIHVVFVEDSQADVELAVGLLERDGIGVRYTRVDTEAGLRTALAGGAPDLILSDFSMPQFDGTSALQITRELVPDVPFIFVSGAIGEERAIEALHHGAADYVLKDNLRRLPTSVKRALEHSGERRRRVGVEQERARLAEIIEATADLVAIVETDGRLRYLNAAGARLLAAVREDILGRPLSRFCPQWAHALIEGEALPAAASRGSWRGEAALLAAGEFEVPVVLQVLSHRDYEGLVTYYSIIARDIRDRKEYEQRIERFANYDRLTNIPNRRLLADRGTQAIAHARRSGRPCVLLIVKIDCVTLINESYGYHAGDELLRLVAKRLQSTLRDGDTVARSGDDAFAILGADLARPEDALLIVTKIQDCMLPPFLIEGCDIRVTVSTGISIFPRDGSTFDVLLRNAATATHRASEQGGNQHRFYFPDMNDAAQETLRLQAALVRAVEGEQFVLHYQPKVDLRDGRITGFEALLRWDHPDRGLVAPAEFISVMEETGLIVKAGEWVIKEVCRQLQVWHGQGLPSHPVAINLSARQFQQKDLDQFIRTVLDVTGIDPALLEFELTESMVMGDAEEAAHMMNNLKACGVKLTIDDFGTGYSSLAYLRRFPIDALKIDRLFIADVPANQEDAAIIRAIIDLAHTLRFKVIAEGVETKSQISFLSLHGCDEMQGYYFSPPVCPGEASDMLRQHRSLVSPAAHGQAGACNLLLVDDEENVLAAIQRVLRQDNYRIFTAKSPTEAFEILSSQPVGVIVSDQRIVGTTGVEFLRRVKDLYPQAVRVVLSGYTDLDTVTDAINQGAIYRFLTKPWDDNLLRAHIAEAFRHYAVMVDSRRVHEHMRSTIEELTSANRELRARLNGHGRRRRTNPSKRAGGAAPLK